MNSPEIIAASRDGVKVPIVPAIGQSEAVGEVIGEAAGEVCGDYVPDGGEDSTTWRTVEVSTGGHSPFPAWLSDLQSKIVTFPHQLRDRTNVPETPSLRVHSVAESLFKQELILYF